MSTQKIGETINKTIKARNKVENKPLDFNLFIRLVGATQGDKLISKDEAKEIVKALTDRGGTSIKEKREFFWFLAQHPNVRISAEADKILSKALDVKTLVRSEAFTKTYEKLNGEHDIALFYAAKSAMTPKQISNMWDEGITPQKLIEFANNGLKPAFPYQLQEQFKDEYDAVINDPKLDSATRKKIENGQISRAEFANLQYALWEKNDKTLKGLTPFYDNYQTLITKPYFEKLK